jgi:restriction endonuclease S subunit
MAVISDSKCTSGGKTRFAEMSDLLLAITGATIGKIGMVTRNEYIAFSGDLLRLRCHESVQPEYLLTVLASPIGQTQFQRWITGSTNGHLGPKDVLRIQIPRLPEQAERRIATLVKESLQTRRDSEELLTQARTRVEQLIEEAAAKAASA